MSGLLLQHQAEVQCTCWCQVTVGFVICFERKKKIVISVPQILENVIGILYSVLDY
jgi:hypothetical protein